MVQLTWLVTGCSSGFGEQFVNEIIARGDRVVATARRAKERLGHLKAAGASVLDLDLTWPQQQIDDTIRQAIDIYSGIDVLVNNAGYVEAGLVEEVSQERLLEQCNTNLFGTINVTRSILPHFRQQKAGKIAFIGSLGGFIGIVGGGAYCMTKFALEAFSECLQIETADFGIQTIIFEAGYYRTEVFGSNMKDNLSVIEDNMKLYDEIQTALTAYHGNQRGDPKKAAERMVDVLKSEGMAAGRSMPPRMPLGPDALAGVRAKCKATLKICDEWEGLISSTDFALQE